MTTQINRPPPPDAPDDFLLLLRNYTEMWQSTTRANPVWKLKNAYYFEHFIRSVSSSVKLLPLYILSTSWFSVLSIEGQQLTRFVECHWTAIVLQWVGDRPTINADTVLTWSTSITNVTQLQTLLHPKSNPHHTVYPPHTNDALTNNMMTQFANNKCFIQWNAMNYSPNKNTECTERCHQSCWSKGVRSKIGRFTNTH